MIYFEYKKEGKSRVRRERKRDSERKRRVNSSTVRGHQRFVFPKVSDFTADLSGLDDFLDGLLLPSAF